MKRRGAIGVVLFFGFVSVLAGCGDSATDFEVNSPLLEAAGVNVKEKLMGKAAPEPDLPERGALVLPPRNAELPVPGSGPRLASNQQWPKDAGDIKKEAKKAAAAAHEEFCKNGEWTGKGTIDDFRKNTGQDPRCRPKWVENASKEEDVKKK